MARPLKYKSVEKLQEAIEQYFRDCEGHVFTDDEGQAVLDKFGRPVIMGQKPPTVTGLALALGFTTRLSLINYQGRKEFMNTITRAKSYIEAYTEGRLFDRDGVHGAKFSLVNNFKGWRDKPEDDTATETLNKLDKILSDIDQVMKSD